MSDDSIGYPLPVIKNGFACLNAFEIELARKNIDPARPKAAPESNRVQPAVVEPVLVQPPRPDEAIEPGSVTGYAADAIRRSPAATGTRLSLTA